MLSLHDLFTNGAVFRRNMPIAVFGTGRGKIVVSFDGETRETVADGKFSVLFSPRRPGGPFTLIATDGKTEITVSDIMVGEVIMVAGQSNAELTIRETYAQNERFTANPDVRYFATPRPDTDKTDFHIVPVKDPLIGKWTSLTQENAPGWSAIALHAALSLYGKLGIAVGIIACFRGATVIESFLSEEANARFDLDPNQLMADHYKPEYGWNFPAFLYHYSLESLFPFRFGGVIWYQGESNRTLYEGSLYDSLLATMVAEWRNKFQNPNLPFAIIQINLYPSKTNPQPGVVAIREAQIRATRSIPNSVLVRIDDLGEHEKIHPQNKDLVAERALSALLPLMD